MEIRVLRYFLAIAREESITGAAKFLHVTQPTLSRQIKELEDTLGQKLFIRGSHHVRLTNEGMFFRKRAEEIIAMVDKTESDFSAMGQAVYGDIYIGGGETQALKPVAQILKRMRDKFPGIRYHLYSGNSQDVTEKLDKGLLDFGILIQPASLAKYDSIRVPAKDIWGVVMRKDSPLAQKAFICKQDLLQVPVICSRQVMEEGRSGNEFVEWFGQDYDKLDIVTSFNLLYNAAILVDAGIGYAVTIDKLVDTTPTSNLCFRPLEPRLESGLNIVWKKYQIFSAAAELFLKELNDTFPTP